MKGSTQARLAGATGEQRERIWGFLVSPASDTFGRCKRFISVEQVCEVKFKARRSKLGERGRPGGGGSARTWGPCVHLLQRVIPARELPACPATTKAMVACGLGLWAWVNLHPGAAQGALPYELIYQRATNEFAEAVFFKPVETTSKDLSFTLAPLILQQVNDGKEPVSVSDRFGMLSVSNGVPSLDGSRPAVYWEADTVQIQGKPHARFSYMWCYSPQSPGTGPSRGTNSTAAGRTEPGLPSQGIRITLNSAGQPAIWEVLADRFGAKLFFASQNLEAAAMAEFGRPLSGRHFAIERSVAAAPAVVVARVIDDSPVAAGPIVYLSADTHAVSTLICRCMAAQAKKLRATRTYDLLPLQSISTNPLMMQAREELANQAAFWPGDHAGGEQLDVSLRLPRAFSDSGGTGAR
jgi:hypothetical protein